MNASFIIEAVCAQTGAEPAALHGRTRAREVSYARHLAMYVLKVRYHVSVAEVGRVLGGRDHSTVLSGVKRIGLELTTRRETHADLIAVLRSLPRSDQEWAARERDEIEPWPETPTQIGRWSNPQRLTAARVAIV